MCILPKEMNIDLAIVIVADNRAECEKENEYG